MSNKSICRFCKNWGGNTFSVAHLLLPTIKGGYGWTDSVEASKYILESRTKETNSWECKSLTDLVEVDIDQGSGWDSGGASVEVINTPGDFGCINFVPYEA